MRNSHQRLYTLSRDRTFLVRASLFLGISFLLGAFLLSRLAPREPVPEFLMASDEGREEQREKFLEQIFREADADTAQVAEWIRMGPYLGLMGLDGLLTVDPEKITEMLAGSDGQLLESMEEMVARSQVSDEDKALLENLARGLYGKKEQKEEARAFLEERAAVSPPIRFANEFLGDVLMLAEESSEALPHYQVEGDTFEDAGRARKRTIRLLAQKNRQDELDQLLRDNRYRQELSHTERMNLALKFRDWPAVFRNLVASEWDSLFSRYFLLSLFAGGIWFVIIVQMAGFEKRAIFTCLLAVVFGMVSASFTLLVYLYQEEVRGFTMGGDLVQQFIYCVAGIGLREETLKLLLFAPLLLLLRGRSEIEALVAASMVGLGFAILENVNYYHAGTHSSPWVRFLTANFLHLSLTGLLGRALYRFTQYPSRRWEEFLATFILVVAGHGVYDLLLMSPELVDYEILYIIVFAALAYRYLEVAEQFRVSGRSQTISPMGIFVIGSTVLVGTVLLFAAWELPIRDALLSVGEGTLALAPVAFIFINRFRQV